MEHQLTESSILKNSSVRSSSSSILKNNYMLNAIESDTDTAISDSKIIFDVNRFHTIDLLNITNKPTECVPITKHHTNICIRSHSEQLLSPTSELYECFYLFDDNNKEQSIIDEKKNNPVRINDIIINDYFKINNNNNIQNKTNILFDSPITIKKEIINKSIDRSHINGSNNILHSDNNINIIESDHDEIEDDSEYNSFSLFNDYESSSGNNFEYKSTFKINVPTIKIHLKPVRPAFKLHLEMVDDDGSIKREIMEHREYCRTLNNKAICIEQHKLYRNNKAICIKQHKLYRNNKRKYKYNRW